MCHKMYLCLWAAILTIGAAGHFDEGYFHFSKAPSWKSHCADPSEIASMRRIPRLSEKALQLNPKFMQVQMFTRHGARTPTRRHYGCWEGYDPVWNCNATDAVLSIPNRSNLRATSFLLQKRYDADVNANVLKGSCQVGQLIEVGTEQHKIVGQLVAEAYFNTNRTNWLLPEPLLNFHDRNNNTYNFAEIYFRSTDYQRTMTSGIHLMTSLLQQIATTVEGSEAFSREATSSIPMHTVDADVEYMYPMWQNSLMKEYVQQLKNSKSFNLLQRHNLPFAERLSKVLGVNLVENRAWGETLMDCFITSACSSDHPSDLHEGLKDEALAQETYIRASKEAMYFVIFGGGKISKLATKQMLSDVRYDILKVLCEDCKNANRLEAVLSKYGISFANQSGTTEVALKTIANWPVKRLSYWSGHDATIMPVLAALGIFDGWWAPYASLFTIELYSIQEGLNVAFRIIYNSIDLTGSFRGCSADTLCPISKFFEATSWAWDSENSELLVLERSLVTVPKPSGSIMFFAVTFVLLIALLSLSCIKRSLLNFNTSSSTGKWSIGRPFWFLRKQYVPL